MGKNCERLDNYLQRNLIELIKMIKTFQINDWKISKLLIIVSVIQIAVLSLIALDSMGLSINGLREVFGFFYLTFIPGILILRLFKLKNLSGSETILYSIGASLAILMFTGFLMNLLYPYIGIKNPISIYPLIITISIIVFILSIFCYILNEKVPKNQFDSQKINLLSPYFLLLSLMPFFSIIGTYLMNNYHNNILLMILIILIGIIIILAAFRKLPKELYPYAIFVISISLLFHNSLISNYLFGWDIHKEYYFANLVIMNGIWDFNMPGNVNAMLSITTLAPIYSIILNTNLIWIYKIVYPLLFAFVPLGLYRIIQVQLKDKIAFFSCSFFIFFFVFYTEMIQIARQEIAEIFFILLILLIIDKNKNIGKSILLIIFAFSLVVSHYGLSYLFLIIIIFYFILTYLINNIEKFKVLNKLNISNKYEITKKNNLQFTFILFFIAFVLTWYIYITSSHAFITVVKIGDQIASSIYTEFMNPNSVQGLYVLQKSASSPLHTVSKILQIIGQFLIVIGFLSTLFKLNKFKINKDYFIFSLGGLILLIMSITIPYFSSSLNTSRMYQITLILLAPFCVIGTITLINWLNNLINIKLTKDLSLKVFSIFLVFFLFFNTGLSFEITNDIPISYSLNSNVDYPKFNSEDFMSAKWIMGRKNENLVYADDYRTPLLFSFDRWNIQSYNSTKLKLNKLQTNSYIYLGSFNILNNKMKESDNYSSTEVIFNLKQIYDNGNSRIFLINS